MLCGRKGILTSFGEYFISSRVNSEVFLKKRIDNFFNKIK